MGQQAANSEFDVFQASGNSKHVSDFLVLDEEQ